MNTIHEQAEAVTYELFRTPEGRSDPYPRYHRLRALAPIHRSETVRGWVLTRYDDCNAVLRDPRFIRGYAVSLDQRRPEWRQRLALARGERSMLNMDGPGHTRLRKLVARAFTPRSMERLRPRIEAMVDTHLDRLADAGGGDLMTELAFPLPVQVIGELLGVPEDDRPPFREIVRRFTAVLELGSNPGDLDDADAAVAEMDTYFTGLIAEVRANPRDDLLSALVAVDDAGDRLSDDELRSLASLIFIAGFETTTNLIGNGILALLRHPDELELLRKDADLFVNLPDELLRYDGTVQLTARITAQPVEIDGIVLGANEPVFPVLGAANRDPARYDHPDRLDVTRTDIRPLAFGGGIHFCVGAALARLETEIVFRKLIGRFGDIELGGLAPVRDRLTLRGPGVVPLVVGNGRAATRVSPMPNAAARATDDALPIRPSGDDAAWRAAFRARAETARSQDDDELGDRMRLLGRVPLFRACTRDELAELAATAYPMAFDPGDVLCVEGAEANECYVIAAGEAVATARGRQLAVIGIDDVVGERGPLLGEPRAATVTATSHVLTYAISRKALRRLSALRPELAAAMHDSVAQRYAAARS
jgi:cytochrome P450